MKIVTMLSENVYAVILAGGSGTRFWPKSRHLLPKQLCAIGRSDLTMLEVTLQRLDGLIPPERRLIVTHKDQIEGTKRVAGDMCCHYLAEPEARNTANALALAAVEIKAQHKGAGEPVMISLHADAVIKEENEFRVCLNKAVDLALQDYLAILGIVPSSPETGYGYIERGNGLNQSGTFLVKSFREKPHLELAEQYVKTGSFYWNAGIFVWKVSVLLEELKKYLPVTVEKLQALIRPGIQSINGVPFHDLALIYSQLPRISIDNALLELSKRVAMVEADIGWMDVGSWSALSECFPTDENGNLVYGEAILIDTRDTTIDSDGPLVGCIGLEDMVVVSSKGAILVCPKKRAQEVKEIVEVLKNKGMISLI
jgi:mannose-1-phosphate guanylyltransferase/mannose-6-phosphate isomerase